MQRCGVMLVLVVDEGLHVFRRKNSFYLHRVTFYQILDKVLPQLLL
jgi:hypothetical protein